MTTRAKVVPAEMLEEPVQARRRMHSDGRSLKLVRLLGRSRGFFFFFTGLAPGVLEFLK